MAGREGPRPQAAGIGNSLGAQEVIMAFTDDLTDEQFVAVLKNEMSVLYARLFNLGVGGRFHSFLEWCGVMGEHLNITSDLLKQGLPAFEMNRHTGETPPIAGYSMGYIAEKREALFAGQYMVTTVTDETKKGKGA